MIILEFGERNGRIEEEQELVSHSLEIILISSSYFTTISFFSFCDKLYIPSNFHWFPCMLKV